MFTIKRFNRISEILIQEIIDEAIQSDEDLTDEQKSEQEVQQFIYKRQFDNILDTCKFDFLANFAM